MELKKKKKILTQYYELTGDSVFPMNLYPSFLKILFTKHQGY
jgi:hypothetical protein